MVTLRIVLIVVAFVVLLVIAVENSAFTTEVHLFGREFRNVPLSLVMLYSLAFGAACVGIFTLISEIRLRTRLHRQRREIEALTEELRAYRNAPLAVLREDNRPFDANSAALARDHEIEED